MKLNKALLIVLGGIIFTFSFVLIKNSMSDRHIEKEKVFIRIGLNECAGYSPVLFAKLTGIFERNNLDVTVTYFPGQAESNTSLIKGQNDAIGAVLADVLLLRSNGNKVKAVLLTDYSMDGDVIIANPKIKSIKDLKNKTIGIDSLNSFSQMFVIETLKKNNILESDVTFKIIPYNEVTEALKLHKVDASHTWVPEKNKALKNGNIVVAKAGDIPGIILDTITFSEDFINKNPEAIKLFTKLFYEAQEKMLADPIAATKLMSSFYHNDENDYAESFKDIHFVSVQENIKSIQFINSTNLPQEFGKIYNKFFLERGLVSDPNIYKSIFVEALVR